jgi:TPP-dependent pyruvate/acetoin dehydrogenase alpha subunit
VTDLTLLHRMMLLREFEVALLRNPHHGFQLLSSGEEAVAVGTCAALAPDDMLLASGRSIGPALARGLDPGAVLAEVLGKATGPCGGRAGRGHISQPSAGLFGAHAVVAANLSIAAGVALAAQLQARGAIVACIFGDGACGAGAIHEALNIAAIWKLPLVFVCNNNGYSVATSARSVLAPKALSDLASPFGIPAVTVDGMDVLAVRDAIADAAARARGGDGPSFVECLSCRFYSHSTLTRETRSADELARDRARCPIQSLRARLRERGELDEAAYDQLASAVASEIAAAVAFAEHSPDPDPDAALAEVDG